MDTGSAPSQSNADLSAFTGDWTLDQKRSSVTFQTKAMWVLKVKGEFQAVEGRGHVGEGGTLDGTLVVDVASIDTKNKKRDTHLRTTDFFDIATYPTMTFTATAAHPKSPDRVQVDGNLSINGQTRPLSVDAQVAVGDGVAAVTAEADIDRSQWGISWAKMGAGMTNHVVIKAHFVKA